MLTEEDFARIRMIVREEVKQSADVRCEHTWIFTTGPGAVDPPFCIKCGKKYDPTEFKLA